MGIDTLEGLQKFVEEMREKFKAFAEKIGLLETSKAEGDAKIETLTVDLAESKASNVQFTEKLKNIQALVKVKDAILKESTPEAAAYKIGKMVQLMRRNHHSIRAGRKDDGKAMLDFGATPAVPGAIFDTSPIKIMEGFEEHYLKQFNKAAITSTPFASDEATFFGTYLVPVDTNTELLRIAADTSAMMGRVTIMQVRGTTMYLPKTTDAFAFTLVTNERTAKTEDTLTIGRTTLTTETYAFWIGITEEMDEDSLIGLGSLIRTMGGEAWGTKFDTQCLSDSTYGAMATSGILEVVMGAGHGTFDSIDLVDLDAMIAKLTTRALRQGAAFFMHPTVWDVLVNKTDSNGNYKIRRFSETAPLMVRGYPVVLTDGMPALASSAVSTSFVALGNPRYIVNGDRVGFEFRIFDQQESTMLYDIITLRCRLRQAFALWAPHAWVKLTTSGS